jgi:hypothetical protein
MDLVVFLQGHSVQCLGCASIPEKPNIMMYIAGRLLVQILARIRVSEAFHGFLNSCG